MKRCKVRVIAVKWEDNPSDYLIEVSQSEPVSGWECNDLKHFNIDRFKEGDIKCYTANLQRFNLKCESPFLMTPLFRIFTPSDQSRCAHNGSEYEVCVEKEPKRNFR